MIDPVSLTIAAGSVVIAGCAAVVACFRNQKNSASDTGNDDSYNGMIVSGGETVKTVRSPDGTVTTTKTGPLEFKITCKDQSGNSRDATNQIRGYDQNTVSGMHVANPLLASAQADQNSSSQANAAPSENSAQSAATAAAPQSRPPEVDPSKVMGSHSKKSDFSFKKLTFTFGDNINIDGFNSSDYFVVSANDNNHSNEETSDDQATEISPLMGAADPDPDPDQSEA